MSYRDVQKLLLYRGIAASYEAIHYWCGKFSQRFANVIRYYRCKPNGKWHLDEVRVVITAEVFWLCKAVDVDGNILDIFMHRCNQEAAKKFFCKLLPDQGLAPRVIVADKLNSYAAAKQELLPNTEHRQHKGLNNQIEVSHQWTRSREHKMRCFKSAAQAQRFLAESELIYQQTQPKRHQLSARTTRRMMSEQIQVWQEITGGNVFA